MTRLFFFSQWHSAGILENTSRSTIQAHRLDQPQNQLQQNNILGCAELYNIYKLPPHTPYILINFKGFRRLTPELRAPLHFVP